MINTTIEHVKTRKAFYREYYRKGLNILIVLLAVEFLLTGFAFIIVKDHKVPAFYASSSDGILTPLRPMPEPNRSNNFLLE
jgi:hypothetical protein